MSPGPLHADATSLLTAWRPDDVDQESLRVDYLQHLRSHDDAMWRSCRPDHLTASALIVSDDATAVVLTHHTKVGLWLQTGGHCESGDTTVAGAALREAREESGITALRIDPVPVRLSRHVVPFCGEQQPAHHLDVQFLVIAAPDAPLVRSEESSDLAWWPADAPPDDTDQEVRDLIVAATRRLRGSPSPGRSADSA